MSNEDPLNLVVRDALRHLFDSTHLAKSPLAHALGLADLPDPGLQLRRALVSTIRSLQPLPDAPAQTPDWRTYEILLCRYAQNYSQLEVANQLGIGTRQLRREERRAIQALTAKVRSQLEDSAEHLPPESTEATTIDRSFEAELAWMVASAPQEAANLDEAMSTALDLVQPLIVQQGASVECVPLNEPISLAVHPVGLRQILAGVLVAAIKGTPSQSVRIIARPRDWLVEVHIQVSRRPGASGTRQEAVFGPEKLETTARLVEISGGVLSLRASDTSVTATIALPAAERLPVILIDDSEETRSLLVRYASATRYRVIPAESLAEALVLAKESHPQAIVLDVMMPEVDGFEMLGWLREHPITDQVPLIVCTILADQRELALSLGASGFLAKPVSRQAFLDALDRVCPAVPRSDLLLR